VHTQLNGVTIAYDRVGTGEPVLFLHGFPHSRAIWEPQLAGLACAASCIAPDLRGFGQSEARGPFTMEQYADDAAALLDAERVSQSVVVGLSMGGYIAFAMWRRHPERIRGLVLADTRASADDATARERRLHLMELARQAGSAAVAEAMLPAMIGASTRKRHPQLVESLRRLMALASVEGICGALQAMLDRVDATALLPHIHVPTLVVVGDEDSITPPAEAQRMAEALPRGHLEVIAEAGHLSSYERPAAFNRLLCEFLEQRLP
jgi:3-oxoadipate enol-lactonase